MSLQTGNIVIKGQKAQDILDFAGVGKFGYVDEISGLTVQYTDGKYYWIAQNSWEEHNDESVDGWHVVWGVGTENIPEDKPDWLKQIFEALKQFGQLGIIGILIVILLLGAFYLVLEKKK